MNLTHNSRRPPNSSRRSSRLAVRFGLAAALSGMVGVAGAVPSHALPIGGGFEDVTGTSVISGSVSLGGCVTSSSNIRVRLVRGGITYSGAVSSTRIGYSYVASELPGGSYTMTASVVGGPCAYGVWTTGTQVASVANAATRTGVNFAYRAPRRVSRVPGFLIAGAARVNAGNLAIKLHNLGPQHGSSRQLDNASTISVAGFSTNFTVPEGTVDVDACWLCPDFGDGHFYANDLRTSGVSFSWLSTGGLQVGATFEDAGREVKGYFTPAFTSSSIDDLMPDVEIAGPQIAAKLVPVLDGIGGIKLVPSGGAVFTGSMQATGPCSISGVDVCQALFGYKGRLTSSVQGAANAALNNATVQSLVRDQIRLVLNSYGVGTVTGVFMDGGDLVITE